MSKVSRENRKWIIAVLVSFLIHMLFFFCLPDFRQGRRHNNEVTVRLIEQKIVHNVKPQTVKQTEHVKRQMTKPVSAKKTAEKSTAPVKNKPEISNATPQSSASAETGGGENQVIASAVSQGSAKGSSTAEITDITSLVITKKVTPQYPAFSRKRREEGTAVLLITIENGKVTDCRVERSSGFARLDEAAKCAVSQWNFAQTENAKARVPISFRLSD